MLSLSQLLRIGRRITLALSLAMLCSVVAAEELVVIVNPGSGVEKLSRDEVINIFLGRYKQFPSGLAAQALDTDPLKARFYAELVNKPLADINAYWARLKFSGQTRPPIQAEHTEAALSFVSTQTSGIAYIERSKANKQVRIVFTLSPP